MLFLSATRHEIPQENEGWLMIQSGWQTGTISICFQVSIRDKTIINSSFVVVTLRKILSIQLSPAIIPIGNAEEGKSPVWRWIKAAIRLDCLYLSYTGEMHLLKQLKMYRKKNQTNMHLLNRKKLNRKNLDIYKQHCNIYKKQTGKLFIFCFICWKSLQILTAINKLNFLTNIKKKGSGHFVHCHHNNVWCFFLHFEWDFS